MHSFDLGLFVRDHLRLMRHRGGWCQVPAFLRRPLTPLAALAFLGLQIFHRMAFLIDDLIFPGWRSQPVEKPVFIVGVPRSGTTWLHRLLCQDREHFTAMTLGEMLYAPALCQKLVVRGVLAIDRALGSYLARLSRACQGLVPDPLGEVHDLDLFEPEEDEILLLHLWASRHQTLVFPRDEEHRRLGAFDQQVPAAQRARIMGFYREMLQKHLYAQGSKARYLSKNPAFTSKIQSLAETFPDATILVTQRTPDAVVPSVASLFQQIAREVSLGEAARPHAMDRLLVDLEHSYHYPADQCPRLFPGRWREIRYEWLRANLGEAVGAVYEQLGLVPGVGFQETLRAEAVRAQTYSSTHRYRIEDFGLQPDELRKRLASVYQRFGFD